MFANMNMSCGKRDAITASWGRCKQEPRTEISLDGAEQNNSNTFTESA
jgi:hypothetical protein